MKTVFSKKGREFKPRFELVRKGYDPQTVEACLDEKEKKAETTAREYAETFESLKAENKRLADELQNFRAQEEQIKKALVASSAKADEQINEVKLRCAMEIERIRLFRAKWTACYEELKERYRFGKDALNMESVAVSVENDLRRMLAQDFAMQSGENESAEEAQFRDECERLNGEDLKNEIDELKSKLIAVSKLK